jgi:hypothetical protein
VEKLNTLSNKSLSPWPLDKTVVSTFIAFCGPLYAPGSIEDVIIPSLKRQEKSRLNLKELPGV